MVATLVSLGTNPSVSHAEIWLQYLFTFKPSFLKSVLSFPATVLVAHILLLPFPTFVHLLWVLLLANTLKTSSHPSSIMAMGYIGQ